jgi:endonuclease I
LEYYKTLEGLTGEAFRIQLQNIITTFEKSTNPNYTTTYNSANDNLQDADEDLTNPNNIILIYNGASIKSTWDSASTWNKEHVWAKSLLKFPGGGKAETTTHGPGADLHNLRASNPSINSSRGNKEFASGSGSYGAVNGGWYPGDDHIGDVARIILYMNLRWGDSLANINDIGNLELFLLWHELDPVDDFERNRNNVIYNAQGNRNPFIDVPEFAYVIWGYPENYSENLFEVASIPLLKYDYVDYANRESLFIN